MSRKIDIKKVINSVTSGNLDKIIEYQIVYGDQILEKKIQDHNRVIFYAFLNSKFNIIDYYLSTKNSIKLTKIESSLLAKKLSSKKRFLIWHKILEDNQKLKDFIDYEFFIYKLEEELSHKYDTFEDIDDYLNLFSGEDKYKKIEEFFIKCSKTTKGLILKRHLKLSKLV